MRIGKFSTITGLLFTTSLYIWYLLKNPAMSLQTISLTKYFGEQAAVAGIDIELQKGKITGFIGPNGSGKSTTMRMICGIISPTSGSILYNGETLDMRKKRNKALVGFLPENNPLYYDMFVKEYLLHIARLYRIAKPIKRVMEVISLTGLEREQSKQIGALSKGYKQRVGLAQSIMHSPEILILDEATTGLDPNQIIEIRNLISQLSIDKTVLLSTHILQEVEAICSNIVMIHNGSIVHKGSIEEIKNTMDKGFKALEIEFKEEVGLSHLKQIDGVEYAEKMDHIYVIGFHPQNDIREKIFQFAVQNGFNILSMKEKISSLEDIFKGLSN